jgi:hypothetical protein
MKDMLQYALDGSEPGPAGDKYNRLVRILAQKKGTERPFKAQNISFLHLGEDMLGKCAPAVIAHMQLQQLVVMGGVGQ